MTPPLAELHLHTYGTIRAQDFLAEIAAKRIDWTYFETGFLEAFGSPAPIRELLERHRAGDPTAEADFERLFVFGDDDAGDFARFQAKFNLMINGSALFEHIVHKAPIARAIEEFRRVTSRIADRHRDQGIGYAEQRMMVARMGLDACRAFYSAALEHVADLCDADHTARLAISLPRDDPFPQWRLVQELARGRHGRCLTAIDFCAIEEGFPPKKVAGLFEEVKAFNRAHPDRALAILYHVGESYKDKSLESAIRWVQQVAELGADRLGHAIALGVDPALYGQHTRYESVAERRDQIAYDLAHARGLERHRVAVDEAALHEELAALRSEADDAHIEIGYDEARLEQVRRRQGYAIERVKRTAAVVEVCPTSNRRIADISDPRLHPIHRFVAEGVPFVVSSDDPGLFNTSLDAELDWVYSQAGSELADTLRARAWASRSERLSSRIFA